MLTFSIYRGKDGFRWRAKRKGRIVAEGGEAYLRKPSLLKTVNNFLKAIKAGKYEIIQNPILKNRS